MGEKSWGDDYSPYESRRIFLCLGPGKDSDNMLEACALYEGLKEVVNLIIKEVVVIGDSTNTAYHLFFETLPPDLKLRNIFKRIF